MVTHGLWDVPDKLWRPQNHFMTWFNPGLEILEAPDVFHWRWCHSVTEENATDVMLSVTSFNRNKGVKDCDA
ncbi:hypothetical protein OUZ56_021193 [Daphnia magna]|uniref:Uncharacterized protein n=1 Tax=Daphnia magna TaxID=35525 RepID=A0ABQ9ZGN2_9CRUS|nr:hypothetical protein OUZ56_021193 [Daphnia magna]